MKLDDVKRREVRACLIRQGRTYEDVGRVIGVSKQYVGQCLDPRSRSRFSPEQVRRIAARLKIPAYLLMKERP